MQYTDRQRKSFYRAVQFVAQRRAEGAASLAAKRGRRRRGSCRGEGGALNRRLAPGLGFALLQYFVDHVQRLMSRSDSTLLMNEARRLRGELAHGGYSDKELPKLIGTAGHTWFSVAADVWHSHENELDEEEGSLVENKDAGPSISQ